MNISPRDALSGVVHTRVDTAQGAIQFRSAGMASEVTQVLLHGIGSASASWAYPLGAAVGRGDHRVLAWDAPGYGRSEPLAKDWPSAQDYAERMWSWLDAMHVGQPVVLVGHSLGALMAASAARLQAARVSRVVLLAPAQGYGDAPSPERERMVQSRLSLLQQLGPEGLANARAASMLSPQAGADLIEAVRENMARLDPAGYTQAVQMLAQAVLAQDLKALRCPVVVASGEADTVTPPARCDAVARLAQTTRVSLGPVGHACPLEAAPAVLDLLGLPALGGVK